MGRKPPPAQVFFPSFGVHESCGEVRAVAELVATTLIYTRDFCIRRARARMRKKAWLRATGHLFASGTCRYWGREYKGPSDAAQLAPEELLQRIHDSLELHSIGHTWWPGWRPLPSTTSSRTQTPKKKRSWPQCVPVKLRIAAGTGSPL